MVFVFALGLVFVANELLPLFVLFLLLLWVGVGVLVVVLLL